MKYTQLLFASAVLSAICFSTANKVNAQTNVIAFWDFAADYDFADGGDGPNKQDFLAFDPTTGIGLDNTVSRNANVQAFLGNAGNLDDNGGGGFLSYTSGVSGIEYAPSRTIKFDDLKGGGDPFSIGTQTEFNVSREGGPAEIDDFGNDALLYISLDATGYEDLQFRFDVEGTPEQVDPDDPTDTIGGLPEGFDLFYRVAGSSGTWFRDEGMNNILLDFADADPNAIDPENQVARTDYISLGAALDNQAQIEIIINDFDDGGNDELEIDNIEIVGNAVAVPEPSSAGLLVLAGMGLLGLRRRNR